MKVYDDKHIKNIALLGNVKSGKTTLAETMVFEAGLIKRRGRVEEGSTISDFHDIERERGNSVYATSLHTEWRDCKINIIDTPGLDDFVGEIASSLRVADTCVMLINAQYGVEVGTEVIWNYVERFRKPTIFAVNQVDHAKANYDDAVASLQERFGKAAMLMQYPLSQGEGFNAIIDLLKMTMYRFPAAGGRPEKLPIPDSEREKADKLHNELVEKAAENDEALMELYFEKGSLDEDEMRAGLKIGMRNREIFPIFCMSALKNMGSGRMMGFIDNVAPTASEMVPEQTLDGDKLVCDPAGPPVLFVFKTLIEPYLGRVTFFKVCSGEVTEGMDLVNYQTGDTERLNQLFIMDGKERSQVKKLVSGDIGATLKLKGTATNHTLHGRERKVGLVPMTFPEARIRSAIVARDKKDDEKLSEALRDIQAEDQTLKAEFAPEVLRHQDRLCRTKNSLPGDHPEGGHRHVPPQEAIRRLRPVRRGAHAHRTPCGWGPGAQRSFGARQRGDRPALGGQARLLQLHRGRGHRRPFPALHSQGGHGKDAGRPHHRLLCPRRAGHGF